MKILYLGVLSLFAIPFVFANTQAPITVPEVEQISAPQFEKIEVVEALPKTEILKPKPKITHAQEVWIHALEWCESNGKPTAVNPMDADGTPSYGAFQFKPSTFWHFANRYDVGITVVSDSHLDRDNQYEVVAAMVAHRDEIEWHNQFPGCVKKLGLPPSY
jgi:hypothetical protein